MTELTLLRVNDNPDARWIRMDRTVSMKGGVLEFKDIHLIKL